jgi:hypothetical protein
MVLPVNTVAADLKALCGHFAAALELMFKVQELCRTGAETAAVTQGPVALHLSSMSVSPRRHPGDPYQWLTPNRAGCETLPT